MQIEEIALSDEDRAHLDKVLRQISHRLTIERLEEKMPAVKGLMDENRELIRLLMFTRVLLIQRNEFTMIVDEAGKNRYGQDRGEALDEINALFAQIDRTVARWM